MIRPSVHLAVLAACLLPGLVTPIRADVHRTSAGPVEVTTVIAGLAVPWAVAFLPDGRFLITEREGTLLLAQRISDGDQILTEIAGVPDVRASGQGGLLDVALDPGFAENAKIYLSYAAPDGLFSARTAVARARLDLEGARLTDVEVIFRQFPSKSGGRHFGSRIVPDGEGNLWITTGDRGDRPMAQSRDTHVGKVIRIRPDGSAPPDNPFVANGALPEVWSIGHRNPQGATRGPGGALWTVSHGARGGDEVNRADAGQNHGWPTISYGVHYSGTRIGEGTAKAGMEQPRAYWTPSIAPAGAMIYSGRLFPGWKGDLFTGSLKYGFVSRVDAEDLAPGAINVWDRQERLLDDMLIRVRDVREGPDGAIWFLDEGEGALFRMTPAG